MLVANLHSPEWIHKTIFAAKLLRIYRYLDIKTDAVSFTLTSRYLWLKGYVGHSMFIFVLLMSLKIESVLYTRLRKWM